MCIADLSPLQGQDERGLSRSLLLPYNGTPVSEAIRRVIRGSVIWDRRPLKEKKQDGGVMPSPPVESIALTSYANAAENVVMAIVILCHVADLLCTLTVFIFALFGTTRGRT